MLLDVQPAAGARGAVLAAVDRVEALLNTRTRVGGRAAEAVAEAARRARGLCGARELFPGRTVDICLEQMMSDTILELCLEIEDRYAVAYLLDTVSEQAGEPPAQFRLRVARMVLGGGQLARLRDDVATDALLGMVCVLAPLHAASIWERDADGSTVLVAQAGIDPWSSTRRLAEDVLTGVASEEPAVATAEEAGELAFAAATGGSQARGALVAAAKLEDHDWVVPILEQAAVALGVILERRALLDRCSDREVALSEACERRLGRLALDIHDGPLQNIAGITGDLKLLRHHLEVTTAGMPDNARLLGTVGDLEARLEAVDTEMRDLAHSLESPAIAGRPLAVALGDEVEAFRRRCDISVSLELRGELDELTSSQRTALVRIVQEWLSNVREHSRARAVRLLVRGGRDSLVAEVTDDGCGFDVAATLLEAGRRGRLGLVGVSERARLLGGSCEIDSRPGGPTKLVLELPRWRPRPPAPDGESSAQG